MCFVLSQNRKKNILLPTNKVTNKHINKQTFIKICIYLKYTFLVHSNYDQKRTLIAMHTHAAATQGLLRSPMRAIFQKVPTGL